MSGRLISATIGAILASLAAWVFQDARLGLKVAEARLEVAQLRSEVALAQRAADRRVADAESQAAAKYQGALNAAIEREQALRNDLARLERTSDGLREQAAGAARRLAAAPPAAVLEYALALGVVFEDCRAAYGDMAAKAAGHASDVITLRDAWPDFLAVSTGEGQD